MMIPRAFWLLLLLAVSAVAGRSPFAPPPRTACLPEIALPVPWAVQGIIGDGVRYLAWLRDGQGGRVKVDNDRLLPDGAWRVTAIAPRKVSLTATGHCQAQRIELHLQRR